MIKKIKGFLFTNQNARQTIVKNSFWLSVSNVGGRLIKAIIIIYAARVLGVEKWGIFSYAVTITAFFTIFIDFGINSILIRESTKTEDLAERSRILSTSFIIKTVFLILGAFLIIFIVPHFINVQGVKEILPIVVFIVIFDSFREFGFALNRAYEKMEKEAGLFLLTNVAIVVFGFIFLSIRPSVKSFAFAYALGTGLGVMATAFILREKLRQLFSDFCFKLVKPILSTAWPFAISGVLGILMINTDILLIGGLLTTKDVGLYSAADRIIQIFYIIPSVISVSVLPLFSRIAGKDNTKMRRVMENTLGTVMLVAIPISIGGVILGGNVISFLFGSAYSGATLSFQILILTLMINFPAVILSSAIFSYNNQKSLIVNAIIGGFLNVLLDLILIPRFGITGSAIATLIAISASNTYLWNKMKRINYFKVAPVLKNIVIATLVMAIVTFVLLVLKTNLLVNIGISIFVYFGVLYFTREPLLKDSLAILKIKI